MAPFLTISGFRGDPPAPASCADGCISPLVDIHSATKASPATLLGSTAMTTIRLRSRTLLFAALAGGVAAWAMPAAAQQQAQAPAVNPSPAPVPGLPAQAPGAPPPGFMQGAPDNPAVADI